MKRKSDIVYERTISEALYIIYTGCTVRDVAKVFSISKTSSHKDLNIRLKTYNMELYKQVRSVLDNNYRIKHIRGGISTKNKYANKHI